MSPLFSAVIPTYNRARTVGRAIQSVLAQTYHDYEIWVIDDGTDNTEEVIRPFHDRLNYRRGPGAGVAAARNLGISKASGAYMAFLDADDLWYPHKLEWVARAIQTHSEVGLFYSKLSFTDESGKILWIPRVRDVGRRGYPILLAGNFVANSTAIVRKDCFERVGGFDTELSGCEDWELWIRVARFYPIRLIPKVLVAYEYLSEGSLSSRPAVWLKAHDEVLDKSFRLDPSLSHQTRRWIRSSIAYVKGRIQLAAQAENQALSEFRQAVKLNHANWRALVYIGVLSLPWVRRHLPLRVKRALRLREAYES